MTELGAVVAGVARELAGAGLPSPVADAHHLVAHVLGVHRRELARRIVLRDHLDDARLATLAHLTGRRAAREPLQHLTGTAAFRGLELQVGPGVFVPRPETELTAGLAIAAAMDVAAAVTGERCPLVVDLCTGSAAIALAVAHEVPGATVVAVEVSPEALAWARRNLRRLDPLDRVDLRSGDAADPSVVADLLGSVDVVVANPPYIPPDAEPLEPEVRDHDPAPALFGGGADGLDVARGVVRVARELLRPGGTFVMEHGAGQGAATRVLVSDPAWVHARTQVDLAGRDRALQARRASAPGPR